MHIIGVKNTYSTSEGRFGSPFGFERIIIFQTFCPSDINECETAHDCQDVCENTEGSFTCKCRENFKVDPMDSRNCIRKYQIHYLLGVSQKHIKAHLIILTC
jgi:hypothetical protein